MRAAMQRPFVPRRYFAIAKVRADDGQVSKVAFGLQTQLHESPKREAAINHRAMETDTRG